MTREAFDTLVRGVERQYQGRPFALRAKILLLAIISYAWIAFVPLCFASLGGLLFFGAGQSDSKDAWILVLVGVLMLLGALLTLGRVVWVSIPPPEGRRIDKREAPALFAMLNELRHTLKSAKIHGVIITGQMNAGVQQAPRLGVFGWSRNYLSLGLPLLDCLSPDELRAVLAHEYAHLSAQHGRFSAWIYRLRCTWERLFEKFRQQESTGRAPKRWLSRRFVDWFWPRFHAHTFVLSRSNEYEADAVAARVAGPERCASSLLRVQFYDRLLGEKLWQEVWLGANASAELPDDVYLRIRDGIRAGAPPDESTRWVEQAFRTTTSNADTHPSMSDRLRALSFLPADLDRGHFPPAPRMPLPSAAEALLGTAEAAVRKDVAAQWKKDAAEAWAQTHKRAGALQHRLDSIHQSTAHYSDEDADSLWDKVCVTMNLESLAAAAPLLQRLVELKPDHAAAHFQLGRYLLDNGDPSGEASIERAMELDDDATPHGCENLIAFHRSHGRDARVRELEQRLDRHEAAIKASHAERNAVSKSDSFIAHELPPAELQRLDSVLRSEPLINSAHLTRKKLVHFPKQRVFILVLHVRQGWFGGAKRERHVVQRIFETAMLPGRFLVVTPRGSWRGLARKVRAVTGSRVYSATTFRPAQ